MLKRMLALTGVEAVARFRENGDLVEAYGDLQEQEMERLGRFARDYKRMMQGYGDQFAMFAGKPGWTPANGWIAHGARKSACGVSSIVAIVDNERVSLTEVMRELSAEMFFT